MPFQNCSVGGPRDCGAIVAIVAAGVRDGRFFMALQRSVRRNAIMGAETGSLFAQLDAAGIWYMALKVAVLQHMYPA